MTSTAYDNLLAEMPAIAKAVNAFDSPEVQTSAFTALLQTLGITSNGPASTASQPSETDGKGPEGQRDKNTHPRKQTPPTRSPSSGSTDVTQAVLSNVGPADDFFSAVAHETGVSEEDLRDIFLVENGLLELKVASKDLGEGDKASTATITALLGGAVFAGTTQSRLLFSEIYAVCKAKRCYNLKHGSSYVKATPGFAAIGASKSLALTNRSGWQTEFANAVKRVLHKPESES